MTGASAPKPATVVGDDPRIDRGGPYAATARRAGAARSGASRTPLPGLYLCGAATHPAGSVIALNGRNAAMAVLEDARAGAVLA